MQRQRCRGRERQAHPSHWNIYFYHYPSTLKRTSVLLIQHYRARHHRLLHSTRQPPALSRSVSLQDWRAAPNLPNFRCLICPQSSGSASSRQRTPRLCVASLRILQVHQILRSSLGVSAGIGGMWYTAHLACGPSFHCHL